MKRVALLLGINNYRDPGIQDLQCAGNDAGAVKEMLDKNGFETHLLCDEKVIYNNVTGKIREICQQLRSGDLFLFYFSGHGHEIGDNHYLLCHGATRDTLDINAGGDVVPLAAVRRLSEFGCQTGVHRLFVLDCCRSPILAGARGGVGVGFTGRGIELVAENDHGGYIPPVILRSCGAGQQAYEDPKRGHGFFSLALLDAVQQETVYSFETFFGSVTDKLQELVHPDQQRATLTDFSGRSLPLFPHWVESHSQPHPQSLPPPRPQPQPAPSADIYTLLYDIENLEAKAKKLDVDLESNNEYRENRKKAQFANELKNIKDASQFLNIALDVGKRLVTEKESQLKAEKEARRKAEEEARRKAEEEARRKAEEEARRKAEEEARRKAQIWLDARKQGLKFSDDKTVLLECVNKGIQSVVIPEGVTEIGDYAFSDCLSLTSVTIPEGVTEIGIGAFDRCSSLTSVTIPESVTEICDLAFSDCLSLTSVTIPESVTEICDWAFSDCSSLPSVTIPQGVTKIGISAFDGCSSLTSVTIPDGVTEIGARAFKGCSSLTSVTIPKGVTKIGDYAFSYCRSLTSVTIPEGVTEICDWAFSGCSSLTSVTISESVTEICDWAFSDCRSLTSVTISKGVTKIGDWAFQGCSSLTSVTIPEGVTEIGTGAFDSCRSLTSVTIPKGVTKIGDYAFSYCRSLTSVTIPEGVTEIGESAFDGCSSLTSVDLPGSVESVGKEAFAGTPCEKELRKKYPRLFSF